MTALTQLHRSLNSLLGQRRRGRRLRGLAVLLLAILGCLLALFLLDWLLTLGKLERLAAMGLAIVAVVYLFAHDTWSWLVRRESTVDLALLVERSEQIDSDLVAALQFEAPERHYGGSQQLATAVVDQAGTRAESISWRHTAHETAQRRPLAALFVVGGVLTLLTIIYPGHWQVFLDRLALGSRHYPANTFIAEVRAGGVNVTLGHDEVPPMRLPFGQPVSFTVRASGDLPERGEVRILTSLDQTEATFELRTVPDSAGDYEGELPRLVEELDFQVFLGDDWTEPRRLIAIPLPVVNLTVSAEPPEYAKASAAESTADGGARQIAVIEGSRVLVGIECRNKPLTSVTLAIAGKAYALQPLDDQRHTWQLPPDDTPLASVTEGLRYLIDVIDRDGLSLADPIEGLVRIKADRAPRVTAAVVTQHVLPTAKPTVGYGAVDDFGIAGLRLHCLIAREDGSTEEKWVEIPVEKVTVTLLQGRYPLDLAPWKLNKGDQVRITLEARDHRGDNQGKTAIAEAIVLQVTDERGVLAAMNETDQRTAKQMDQLIQRQLGLGDGP